MSHSRQSGPIPRVTSIRLVRTYELDTAVSVSALGDDRAEGAIDLFLVSYNSYTVLNCVFDVEAMLLELQNTHLAVYVIEIECLKSLFT